MAFFYPKARFPFKFMFAFYALFSTLGSAVTLSMLFADAKEILTFSICSCGWRDDQIRILQGTSGVLSQLPPYKNFRIALFSLPSSAKLYPYN